MQKINNRFADPVIIEVKEIANIQGVSYKVILEHGNRKYNLKLTSAGNITAQIKEKIRK
jgi:hypothetical protein